MNIQNFAFKESLVRVVMLHGEPWFVTKDVCAILNLKNFHSSLAALKESEKGLHSMETIDRGKQQMSIISEQGVYRLVFRSRTPEAEAFKDWLAYEVLPQIRRTGGYSPDPKINGFEPVYVPNVDKDAPLAARVDAIRVAKAIFGRDAAKALWEMLGLPVPQPSAWSGSGEASRVLTTILEHQPEGSDLRSIRTLILDALDGDEIGRLLLLQNGIKPTETPAGYYIGTGHPAMHKLFLGSIEGEGRWRIPLRRLAGGETTGALDNRQTFQQQGPNMKFAGIQSRALWMAISTLDENT